MNRGDRLKPRRNATRVKVLCDQEVILQFTWMNYRFDRDIGIMGRERVKEALSKAVSACRISRFETVLLGQERLLLDHL